MIRVVVKTDGAGMAANVGGSVYERIKSFDIYAPFLEEYLREKLGGYSHRQVVGVEVIEEKGE